ncbi:MAG: TonB-dependent receptor [Prevotella sp.]|nr:TonB-dependent receptor [Prevotella sp.]
MRKTLKLAMLALCCSVPVMAQEPVDSTATDLQDETAFTFTEAQLDDDESTSQNITVISSNRNVYANEVGYRFSPARFKYRALGAKYNEMYINGNPVNNIERGQFDYPFVGGLNNQTRSRESSLPFEDNNYSMSSLGGSGNYNFRPSSFATGQRASLAFANRSYNLRAMYTYNTGVMENGWAFTGSLTYRWGNGLGYIDGTSYNSLSYFLGAEKRINDDHSLSLVTWGNPTERGTQRGATDEMYWIANSHNYNPNWGYQDGKKRNARIVKDFAPAALLTWDWKIDDQSKLVTSLLGRYTMYSNSRLAYNGGTNPEPDYYNLMPSFNYNVWDPEATLFHDDAAYENWQAAYDYLSASEDNRQINWGRLYYANNLMAAEGQDAMYYLQRAHDDQLTFSLATKLEKQLTETAAFSAGLQLATNKGMHYQTMDDLLGNAKFHNVNTYALKDYGSTSPKVFYDMNEGTEAREVKAGDTFGYDYNILVNKAQLWATATKDVNIAHLFASARISGITMQRDGKMRNGMAPDNSYGKSGTAKFLDGGGKVGAHLNLGKGHAVALGTGFEWKAPTPRTSFSAAQINNDFVKDLTQEKIFSAEVGYQYRNSWLSANINAYFASLTDVTEQSLFYSDIESSFAYVSLSDIDKQYYGVELGLNFKVTDWLNVKALGTISEAKYTSNADMRMLLSNTGSYVDELCIIDGMREGGTPLTAGSIDLSYHANGWYIDLIGNYYDNIYLYFAPISRRETEVPKTIVNGEKSFDSPDQSKGDGGFMLDASIGRQFRLGHGRRIGFNLMMTNLLNNIKICTGGMEQNRLDTKQEQERTNNAYRFQQSPRKFYANGINGMLMINYYF